MASAPWNGRSRLTITKSTVDIRDVDARKTDLPAMDFDYQGSPLKIIDTAIRRSHPDAQNDTL